MANRITFGNYTFNDADLIEVSIYQDESLISESLSADTLTATVYSDKVGDKKLYTTFMEWYHTNSDEGYVLEDDNLQDYTYAAPIYYYKNNALYGKFYVTRVDRIAAAKFKIYATSAIGLLIRQDYAGGVYAGVPARTLINDILSGTNIPYSIQTAVGNTVVNGYLKLSNKRDCLQHILFAIGANVIKDAATGQLNFVFNTPTTTTEIESDRIYLGGQNQITSPITRINLSEHTYYQNPSSTSELIYSHSGTAANHSKIVFDSPIIPNTITADSGITVHESGANYIVFSGIGNIYAIKYTHVSTVISWENPDTTLEEHACNVKDATLVTALNSANVLERLKKYYTQAKQTNCEIVVNTERPGDYVSYIDPFGDPVSGFIKSMTINVSGINKAKSEIINNWYPSESGNNFNAYRLIQNTGTITVPASAVGKAGRFVLLGGFRGGQGGTAGESGTAATRGTTTSYGTTINAGTGGTHGGKGGTGGVGVMVKTIDVSSLPNTFTVSAIGTGGAGGAGGAYNGTGSIGSLGGNTTITVSGTSYSSASGSEDTTGFINFIDGTYYNLKGSDGYDNTTGVGGDGSQNGGSVTYGGTTWAGGSKGSNASSGASSMQGGGGGGAAYGVAGGTGRDGRKSYTGDGGTGATPATPSQAEFPYGGSGGHGGGCGGGGGSGWEYYGAAHINPGSGGSGGAGGVGGQGSNGAVIFYYGA